MSDNNIIIKNRFRYELKYFLNKYEFEVINARLHTFLKNDKNVMDDGTYFIRSLYLDNYNDTSFYQVLNGISEREKYRIRYYNNDLNYICLEKKYKINNMTYKTSYRISKKELMDLLNNKLDINKNNNKLLNEFILKIKFMGYKPTVIIDYNRIPFVYEAGNVRITLDYNIAIDTRVDNFLKKEGQAVPIIEKDYCILEVKYDDFLPNYISWLVNINELEQTAYSKYLNGRIMQKRIKGGL